MKTLISIKADKEVKRNAQKVAENLGFTLSALINAYLKQFIRNKEVYFGLIPSMSPELEEILGKIESDINKNKNISSVFSSKRQVKDYLASL